MITLKDTIFISVVFVLLILTPVGHASIATGDLEVSSDNEGLSTSRYLVGYNNKFGKWNLGVQDGKFNIKESSGSILLNDTRFNFARSLTNQLHVNGYIGSLYNSDKSTTVGEVNIDYDRSEKWYISLNVGTNIIDSFKAFNTNIISTGYTLKSNYKFTPQFSGGGLYSGATMSDSNARQKYEGNLIYNLKSVDGMSLQFHHRKQAYDFNPPEYFGPADWTRNLFGIGYIRTLGAKTSVKARILTGPQDIDSTVGTVSELNSKLLYKITKDADVYLDHVSTVSTAGGYVYKWTWYGFGIKYKF